MATTTRTTPESASHSKLDRFPLYFEFTPIRKTEQ